MFTKLFAIVVLGLVIYPPLLLDTNRFSLLPIHQYDVLSLNAVSAARVQSPPTCSTPPPPLIGNDE